MSTRPRWARRNDDGSMLLALLFTLIITSLVAIITATMLAGLTKTRNARDQAIALQAADSAMSHALIYANTTGLSGTTPITKTGTSSNVTWSWTATPSADPAVWTVAVDAQGKSTDRNYTATFTGIRVTSARKSPSTGQITYVVDNSERFSNGFFGANGVTITGAPDLDGYDGSVGILGSNGPFTLSAATIDRLDQWNSTASPSGRCTGTACTLADVQVKGPAYPLDTASTATCTSALATSNGNWTPASGALVAGRCYNSITFNSTATYALAGPVYAFNGVSIATGANVNTAANATTPRARNLRIYVVGGAVSQAAGTKFAGAIYAPTSTCTINATTTDTTFQTRFLGAAVCSNLAVNGPARLRYDGDLKLLASSTAGQYVWSVSDYASND